MARVLVADDEPGIRSLVCALLEEEGYEVVMAPDGPRALEKAIEVRPDVAILDIMMPGLTGQQVVERMDQAGLSETPVIYMSAVSEPVSLDSHRPAVFMSKPFDINRLLDTVSGLVNRFRR